VSRRFIQFPIFLFTFFAMLFPLGSTVTLASGSDTVLVPRPRNLRTLLAEDSVRDGTDVPFRFAVDQPANITPAQWGKWELQPDGADTWRLKIIADGSSSLNLGF
jgi:hypothetical protein